VCSAFLSVFGRKRILVGFIVGIVLLALVSLTTYSTSRSYQNTINTLNSESATGNATSSLLLNLVNAETGQRGYIITGNATYLAPYTSALQSINSTDASLKELVVGSPTLSSDYNELQPLIASKLGDLNYSIVLRQQQGFTAAQAVVDNGSGILYMNEIRVIISNMTSYIQTQESQTLSKANQLNNERLDGVYFWMAVGVGILGYSIYAVREELAGERAALTREQASLAKETVSRRRAELLQDILAHDVRNYNQVTKMTAELLGEQIANDPYSKKLTEDLLAAVDGSTDLVEKAQKIGKVLSNEQVKLHPVNLVKTIEESMALIKKANLSAGKTVSDEMKFPPSNPEQATVLADELLSSVFENIYSNAVRYTDSDLVWIETKVEQEGEYWKITISDRGAGIEDALKSGLFTRYLDSRKGSGLGLSIAHALVVGRYDGKIEVKNRITEDFRKGTSIEIWLKSASPTMQMQEPKDVVEDVPKNYS
jgi:CHASE3 domain sensor protein